MFCFVLVIALLVTSNCRPTEPATPASTAPMLVSKLVPYTKDNGCATQLPQAEGEITFQLTMASVFSGTLKLSGLKENQSYSFAINGLQEDLGNDLLKSSCPHADVVEGYCDRSVRSNQQGEVNELITIQLQPGQYAVKFFVKDEAQDYCPLLYNSDNRVQFEITK
jgi:hypothetical protein